jgi:hypothetical protein
MRRELTGSECLVSDVTMTMAFLKNHLKEIVATDFFIVPTVKNQVLFVFLVLELDRRRVSSATRYWRDCPLMLVNSAVPSPPSGGNRPPTGGYRCGD